MSKPKTKKTEQPRDVTPFWMERGYRPEVAASKPRLGEDPRGEEAYQRAFLEAAQMKIPRLPNPSHYPNSSSAQEYMRKKSMDFLSGRGEKRPIEDTAEALRTARKQRDPDRSPSIPGKTSSSTSPASNYSTSAMPPPPPPQGFSTPRTEQSLNNQLPLPFPQSSQNAPRLAILEPLGAPTGPTNKLR